MGDCEPHENAVNDCKPPKNPPRDPDCPKVGNLNLTGWAIWISLGGQFESQYTLPLIFPRYFLLPLPDRS